MMIIAIAGKGWIAVRTAQLLTALIAVRRLDARVEVVRNRDDTGHDSWLPSLLAMATQRGWPVHETPKDANLGPGDVFLSLQYDRIVYCDTLSGASAYNLHFAHLPRYRGSLTSTIPIRHGETQVGVTLHVLSQEIDAGPVIAARTFELPPFYTAYDLYRAYHDHGFELVKDNVYALLSEPVMAMPQDESAATTFRRSDVDFSDAHLSDFDHDAEQVRDWCRSLIFPPAQYPTYHGRGIRTCYVVHWLGDAERVPGRVVYRDRDHAVIECRHGEICLELLPDSGDGGAARISR
jgi:methionyl-tRNA formyltransferase